MCVGGGGQMRFSQNPNFDILLRPFLNKGDTGFQIWKITWAPQPYQMALMTLIQSILLVKSLLFNPTLFEGKNAKSLDTQNGIGQPPYQSLEILQGCAR